MSQLEQVQSTDRIPGVDADAVPKPQIRLERRTPAYWRVTLDNPPFNIFGPKTIPELNAVITAIENDPMVRVVVFDLAERYGYVNRSLPDGELDAFVESLAMRISTFDRQAIAETKHLVDIASLPADSEIATGWDACIASIQRPPAQGKIKRLMELGLQKNADVEARLPHYTGTLGSN
jgi:enoyl-CoA hydratase/carnithine racemase